MQFILKTDLCSMKMAAAIGAFAVACGVLQALVDMGSAAFGTMKVIGACAFGAFVVICSMKSFMLLKRMEAYCSHIAEKANYMEQRMDAAAGKISDLCRHMQQIFEEFD